ncbi:phosphate ABC transporter substrate-binding protein [Hydrogenophaga aquatica]
MRHRTAIRRRALLKALACVPVALTATAVSAELVVVVNARSGVSSLSREQVVNIFMGRHRLFPHGGRAVPLDAPPGSPERLRFYRLLLNKEPEDVGAYWARLVFTGRTEPPVGLPTLQDVQARVESDIHAVAYLDESVVTRSMQIVMAFAPRSTP